jgi:hypothetical protein
VQRVSGDSLVLYIQRQLRLPETMMKSTRSTNKTSRKQSWSDLRMPFQALCPKRPKNKEQLNELCQEGLSTGLSVRAAPILIAVLLVGLCAYPDKSSGIEQQVVSHN